MYLTQSNARQYLGKSLDAEHRLLHHYPLTVVQLPDGGLYYRDAFGVCMPIPGDEDTSNRVHFDIVLETEAVEICPWCSGENTYPNWIVEKQGYETKCRSCGHKVLLCDECLHAEDNPGGRCDWSEQGCFRQRKEGGNNA